MPFWASGYHLQLASTALVSAMFALSLQLLVGAAGMVSLGHAAFFGVGAYAVHLLPAGLSILVTLPAAALMAAAAALPVGALSLRTRGFFFLMTTLAFGQMLFFLFHDTPLGGGKDGVFVTRPALEAFGAALEVPRRSRPTDAAAAQSRRAGGDVCRPRRVDADPLRPRAPGHPREREPDARARLRHAGA